MIRNTGVMIRNASVSDPLEVSLSVVGVLECVVRRCVGPRGGTVIFTKDTGDTLISKHGHQILTALHLEHPTARMVLECLCEHHRVTADGSKSFILLLAALRQIQESVHNSAQTHRRHAAWTLANQLHVFCEEGLDDVIAHGIIPYVSSLFGPGGCEPEGGVLAALVGGYIGGRVSPCQAAVLTPLLCEFYMRVKHRSTDCAAISFIHSHFSGLHTALSGLHSAQSHIVKGLLLPCNWSAWNETDGPVRALVVFEKLDACYDESVGVDFQEDWTVRTDSLIKERLARILRLQVKVVLSVVKQPACVLEWACLNAVSVLDCCEPEQLDLLCELGTPETITVTPMRVLTLTHCRRFQFGGHRYVKVGVTHTLLHTHTLVLCEPAPGPLEKSVSVSRGVFSMLQHLKRSHRHIASSHPHKQCPTSSWCPTSPRDYALSQCSVSSQYLASSPCPGSSQCPASSQCPTSCQCSMSSQCPKSAQCPISSQLQSQCPNLHQCNLNINDVIPVGGVFEFLFHRSLLHSNHGDPVSRRLLAEAILSVPKSLHSQKPGNFLKGLIQFMNKPQHHHRIREHGSRSQLMWGLGADGLGNVFVEALCSKQQLVASVLQCVNRLLRVEIVIHTPGSRALTSHEPDSEDEDNADDEDRARTRHHVIDFLQK